MGIRVFNDIEETTRLWLGPKIGHILPNTVHPARARIGREPTVLIISLYTLRSLAR